MGLRDIRLARGLTQDELAAKSGVDQSYISALEVSTDPNPGWHTVRRLTKALNAKPHDLFPREPKHREASSSR